MPGRKEQWAKAVILVVLFWWVKWEQECSAHHHAGPCLLPWLASIGKDDKEAVILLLKAAEQGDAVAQNNLGFDYFNGYGVELNYVESANWYRKAAEQGNADGQRKFCFAYNNGFGVERDDQEGIKWCRKAADPGNAPAQKPTGF